ncbi:hypothetical protein J2128_001713 [Methanomicrobium sp. W14]|uniref:DUF7288 family protein n=1 Tax=Methanomicrobium sp. W14 TaxID=2817839 RepID=UPI001AE6A20C|nr:hypothetical protein [Methanomicrobium sp. W14]MBP2133759.1 hypothetical protein [Methanomicrobium sp. W14]
MVKSLSCSGQLYTIEGLTAAVIMLVSAYVVLGTGMVLTPGDVHIPDMQLEQLGNDALLMMDTKDTYTEGNVLSSIISNASGNSDPDGPAASEFNSAFQNYLDMNTGATAFVNSLRYNSTIYYYDQTTKTVKAVPFAHSSEGDNPGRSPAIRCGRYVTADWKGKETVLKLEVLLWRD